MIIEQIILLNFKKYAREHLRLGPGVTGIFGANGAGKSTVFDAICWCLYGVTPALGREGAVIRQEDLVRDGQEDMGVEMAFNHGGQRFVVSRSYAPHTGVSARVRADNQEVARTSSEVTSFITRLLGLDAKAFVSSSFIRQKEIDLLTSQRPGKRKDTINRLFGLQVYDQYLADAKALQLEVRQEQARLDERCRALADEDASLEASLLQYGDVDVRLSAATRGAEEAAAAVAAADAALAEIEAAYEAHHALVAQRDRLSERLLAVRNALGEKEAAYQEAVASGEALRSCEERLTALRPGRDAYARLQPLVERREACNAQRTRHAGEHARMGARHERERKAAERAVDTAFQKWEQAQHARAHASTAFLSAGEATTDIAVCTEALEQVEGRMQKMRDRQASERERIRGLDEALQSHDEELLRLRSLSHEAECPLCHQALSEEHMRVLLSEQESRRAALATKGEQARGRLNWLDGMLSEEAAALQTAKAALEGARSAERNREKAEAALAYARSLETAAEEAYRLALSSRDTCVSSHEEEYLASERVLHALDAELAVIDTDLGELEKARADAEAYLAEERRRDILVHMGSQKDSLRTQIHTIRGEIAGYVSELALMEARIKERVVARGQVEEARAAVRSALAAESSIREEVAVLSEKAHARDSVGVQRTRCREALDSAHTELAEAEATIRDYEVLKQAFRDIPVNIHERLKPAIQGEVSQLLDTVTAGKYRAVRIGEDYAIEILYQGTYYPIHRFSGGEKDLINVCLRIGISHVLVTSSKAGGASRMESLFLDETFSSLDRDRRQMLIGALQSLRTFFAQIVIITHVEDVRDTISHAVEVSEDVHGIAHIETL